MTTFDHGLCGRSFLLGAAVGARSSLAVLAPARRSDSRAASAFATAMIAGEMTVDKLPVAPDRTATAPALARAVAGAGGGWFLARRAGASPLVPAVTAAAGAVVGTRAGAVWRELAQRRGDTWRAALAEDAAATALAWFATRRR